MVCADRSVCAEPCLHSNTRTDALGAASSCAVLKQNKLIAWIAYSRCHTGDPLQKYQTGLIEQGSCSGNVNVTQSDVSGYVINNEEC